MRVLVVEDDEQLASDLDAALTSTGFIVERESDGEIGWYRGDAEQFDAIILDLGLPKLDGLLILRRWRKAGRHTPVLVLTARGNWEERVEGIETGADDYVVKPFRMEELVARVRALIRRSAGIGTPRIEFGDFVLEQRLMQVARGGIPIALTPQEFKLISYLVLHRGRVVSQSELTEHIYDQEYERESNSIEVLVGRVRKRLGHDVIQTRRGFGYFVEEPSA
jgi:DNA-binding response OmpR family regulator